MTRILVTLGLAALAIVLLRIFVPASFYTGSAIVLALALLRLLWLLIFRRKAG